MVKQLTEAALERRPESHLSKEIIVNRWNSKSKKTMKSMGDSFGLEVFRRPEIVQALLLSRLFKKYQTTITDEIEQRIIVLYTEYEL